MISVYFFKVVATRLGWFEQWGCWSGIANGKEDPYGSPHLDCSNFERNQSYSI